MNARENFRLDQIKEILQGLTSMQCVFDVMNQNGYTIPLNYTQAWNIRFNQMTVYLNGNSTVARTLFDNTYKGMNSDGDFMFMKANLALQNYGSLILILEEFSDRIRIQVLNSIRGILQM